MKRETLKTGCLAYLDMCESGLIPCKVLSITAPKEPLLFHLTLGGISTSIKTKVVLTDTVRAYKKGEVLENDAAHTVPRKSIYKKGGRIWIAGYDVKIDE